MLIQSHRHTCADLEHWAELEAVDRLRARRIDHMIDRAMETLRLFLADGPAYVSCSTGKDSVVALCLARQIDPEIPAIWWTSPPSPTMTAWPEESHVMADLLGIDVAPVSEWRASVIEHEARSRYGTARRIMGIRRDESGARKISAAVHGLATERVCRPLLYWNHRHIFAALARLAAPIHAVYAMTGGGRWPRETLRVDCIGGPEGTHSGRAEWEKEYYGDLINRGASRCPV